VSSPSIISPSEPKWDPSDGVYISLGSNLDFCGLSSHALLQRAIDRIEIGGDVILATSSFWVSDAWPAQTGAPKFINSVCRVQPLDHDPAMLLARLHQIEAEFGRRRDQHNRWSERTLDLDLLDYNGLVWENNSFVILPHPRIEGRDFVLEPLLEVCVNWVHPITREKGWILLDRLKKAQKTNNCVQLSF
jgi:2-amino-4-hydroxy-6-hydroxymethyldihydropteridine diphosphokinase